MHSTTFRGTGHHVAFCFRTVTAALHIAVWVVVVLLLAAERSALGGQPQPQYGPNGSAEVVPAPLPAPARPKEPLAELITDENYKDEFRGIGHLSVDIRPRDIRQGKPLGDMPPNLASSVLSSQMQTSGWKCRREWPGLCFHWEASGLFHQPLYFEETNLERYGYSPRGLRLFQPLLSAGNFFLTIPLLPYKMAVQPPRQEIYTLGQYRPGSPVPYRINRPQFRLVGVVAEAAVIGGLILLIP